MGFTIIPPRLNIIMPVEEIDKQSFIAIEDLMYIIAILLLSPPPAFLATAHHFLLQHVFQFVQQVLFFHVAESEHLVEQILRSAFLLVFKRLVTDLRESHRLIERGQLAVLTPLVVLSVQFNEVLFYLLVLELFLFTAFAYFTSEPTTVRLKGVITDELPEVILLEILRILVWVH